MANRAFSIEEGNTQVASVVSSRLVDYKDIDLTFTPNSIGDIYKKTDAAAVKQSVKNLILTSYYEKPFSPFFGTDIRSLLFDLYDAGLKFDIDLRIKAAINSYEPRAFIENINVTPFEDDNSLDVVITFKILNTKESVTLSTSISRLR